MSLSIAVSYCVNKRLSWAWLTDAPMPHSRVVLFDCGVKAKSSNKFNDLLLTVASFYKSPVAKMSIRNYNNIQF